MGSASQDLPLLNIITVVDPLLYEQWITPLAYHLMLTVGTSHVQEQRNGSKSHRGTATELIDEKQLAAELRMSWRH
jgi:hypothetical protein